MSASRALRRLSFDWYGRSAGESDWATVLAAGKWALDATYRASGLPVFLAAVEPAAG